MLQRSSPAPLSRTAASSRAALLLLSLSLSVVLMLSCLPIPSLALFVTTTEGGFPVSQVTALFGPQSAELNVTGLPAFATTLLCEDEKTATDFYNDTLADKIVLVRRGECNFFFKAKLAQTLGATAVVVGNNEDYLFSMSYPDDVNPDAVTVKTVLIRYTAFNGILTLFNLTETQSLTEPDQVLTPSNYSKLSNNHDPASESDSNDKSPPPPPPRPPRPPLMSRGAVLRSLALEASRDYITDVGGSSPAQAESAARALAASMASYESAEPFAHSPHHSPDTSAAPPPPPRRGQRRLPSAAAAAVGRVIAALTGYTPMDGETAVGVSLEVSSAGEVSVSPVPEVLEYIIIAMIVFPLFFCLYFAGMMMRRVCARRILREQAVDVGRALSTAVYVPPSARLQYDPAMRKGAPAVVTDDTYVVEPGGSLRLLCRGPNTNVQSAEAVANPALGARSNSGSSARSGSGSSSSSSASAAAAGAGPSAGAGYGSIGATSSFPTGGGFTLGGSLSSYSAPSASAAADDTATAAALSAGARAGHRTSDAGSTLGLGGAGRAASAGDALISAAGEADGIEMSLLSPRSAAAPSDAAAAAAIAASAAAGEVRRVVTCVTVAPGTKTCGPASDSNSNAVSGSGSINDGGGGGSNGAAGNTAGGGLVTAARLPTHAHIHNDSCTVCLDDFTTGGDVKPLPCGHAFHAACIDAWLERIVGDAVRCPTCNASILSALEAARWENASCGTKMYRVFCACEPCTRRVRAGERREPEDDI